MDSTPDKPHTDPEDAASDVSIDDEEVKIEPEFDVDGEFINIDTTAAWGGFEDQNPDVSIDDEEGKIEPEFDVDGEFINTRTTAAWGGFEDQNPDIEATVSSVYRNSKDHTYSASIGTRPKTGRRYRGKKASIGTRPKTGRRNNRGKKSHYNKQVQTEGAYTSEDICGIDFFLQFKTTTRGDTASGWEDSTTQYDYFRSL